MTPEAELMMADATKEVLRLVAGQLETMRVEGIPRVYRWEWFQLMMNTVRATHGSVPMM